MTPEPEREIELLTAAAECMEGGYDPFSHGFLSANDVTLGECLWLSAMLALLARTRAEEIRRRDDH